MQLFTRKLEVQLPANQADGNLPLVILHGLFGSGDNWNSVARATARRRLVVCPDLSNHGRSPHSPHCTYPSMAADLWETLDAIGIHRCVLLGHSMGGKVAMVAALARPQQVAGLVVADIAPKNYPRVHAALMETMQMVERAAVASRQDAEVIMQKRIDDANKRAFLLKSLVPHTEQQQRHYVWRFNLAAIHADYDTICDWPHVDGRYDGPLLSIIGGNSAYSSAGDLNLFRKQFPQAQVQVLANAGHWLHVDAPDDFLHLVENFLEHVQ